jgi:hypothetical protein
MKAGHVGAFEVVSSFLATTKKFKKEDCHCPTFGRLPL